MWLLPVQLRSGRCAGDRLNNNKGELSMDNLTPQSTLAQALKNPKAVALAEKLKPGITKNPLSPLLKVPL